MNNLESLPDTNSSNLDSPPLPTPRNWAVRHSGYPWLGGPMEEQVTRARAALQAIRKSDGAHTTELDAGYGEVRTIGWYSRQLSPSGMLSSNGQGHIKVSDDAERWLDTEDDRILAGLLHARILLFGEILLILQSSPPLTHEELRVVANRDYGIDWKTADPIRKRVGWLRPLRLVEFSFDHKLSLTSKGEQLIELLDIVRPEELAQRSQISVETQSIALPSVIGERVCALTPEALSRRKVAFGYIPRTNAQTIYESFHLLCSWFEYGATKEDFLQKAEDVFGVKESSGTSALYALGAFGLIERVSMTEYRVADLCQAWLQSGEKMPLAAIMHTHLQIFGELIPHLEDVTRVPALQKIINETYGVNIGLQGIRSRINLLHACGAVEQLAPGRFRSTPSGRSFSDSVPLLEPSEELGGVASASQAPKSREPDDTTVMVSELLESSTDSQHPDRFELSAERVFTYLGYQAEHLGGPGNTDVLVHYSHKPGQQRRFIVDTKASAVGSVTDSMIQIPALKDHTKKHNADFAVVVANAFSGRIIDWAAQNGVMLVDVKHLSEIVNRQTRTPAPLSAVTAYFAGKEDAWTALQVEWRERDDSVNLLSEVVDCLRREHRTPDDETGGALTAEQIYFLLRNSFEPRPTQATIRPLLDFLASPLVRGSKPEGKGWIMPDPPSQIARRLRDIANRIESVSETGIE